MKIHRHHWLIFTLLAIIATGVWFRFTYPRYSIIDLSFDRHQALKIAKKYLREEIGVEPDKYHTAAIFLFDRQSDRYLQKSLGFYGEKQFLQDNDFELFFWLIRFYKEKEKEEFKVTVSCKTGEITSFLHALDDTDPGANLTREEALKIGQDFLQKRFGTDFSNYTIKGDLQSEQEFRTDYKFSWEKNGSAISWSDKKEDGSSKFLIGVSIGGDRVITFSKHSLSIPEKFNRYLAEQQSLGASLLTFLRILQILIFVGAIFYVVVRRNHLVMHTTKWFYIGLTVFLFFITVLSELNQLQHILISYDTTQPLKSYFARYAVNTLVHIFFITIGILMPSLSGESLHYEEYKNKQEGRFLYYIRTTFLNRDVFFRVLLGYLVCIVLIGLQSLAVRVGQTYWGVWLESTWLTQLSSTYLPFFAAFVIGIKASVFEEIIFRLFCISWFKHLFKSSVAAVILAAFIWGFCHSGYLVFPMWFRGVEVTLIGLVFGFVFLRFGIIPVLVAHYAFDTFWASSGYLFGSAAPIYFWTSLGVIFLPLLAGAAAFAVNRPVELSRLKWRLNQHQKFNLEVLKGYLAGGNIPKDATYEALKHDIAGHGWDVAVVETALEDIGLTSKADHE